MTTAIADPALNDEFITDYVEFCAGRWGVDPEEALKYLNAQDWTPLGKDEKYDPKQALVNFIKMADEAVTEKKVTQAEIEAICVKHGVASLSLLANRLDLVRDIAVDVGCLIMTRW